MPHPTCFKGAQFGLLANISDDQPADIKIGTPGFSRIMPKSSGGYTHTSSGNRLVTKILPPGLHWGEVDFKGPMTYGLDMLLMLAAGMGVPTPVADGTNGWIWDFFFALNSALTPQFLAYENGNEDRAERALKTFVNSYVFNMSKGTQEYSGRMLTGKKERGVTITGSPTETDSPIVLSQSIDFYQGDTKAALDTAVSSDDKFPIPLSLVLTIPDMAEIMSRMNSAENSFFARNEKAVIPTLALKTTDDDDFDDLVAILDTGEPKFFAARSLGNAIPGGTPSQEELRVDFCGGLTEPETPEEEAAAAANTLLFQNKYDTTWGQSLNIRLVNDQPDLQP